MKRFISIVMVLLLLFSLCACNKEISNKNIITANSSKDEAPLKLDFPAPSKLMWEESDNKLGAQYVFTLKEYTDLLNSACENMAPNEALQYFDYSNWQLMSNNLVDDNGIKYSSYYYSTDKLTITAAVENESGKMMNVGCGSSYDEFVQADAEYQYTVMLTAAILSMVAGGYSEEDLEFLYYIFFDSAKSKTGFYYNNGVYMMELSKAEGEESAAVLFMTSPCKDDILTQWELTDYTEYEDSARYDD